MKNPELSVVVPILGYTSIGTFMQTLQVAWRDSIEVIILDSTKFGERHDTVNYDESGKSTIIRAIIDPAINFFATLNMGIRMARGQYIAICHDDILFGNLSLEHCVNAIETFDNGGVPVVCPRSTSGPAHVEHFESEGKAVSQLPLELLGLDQYKADTNEHCWVMANDVPGLMGSFSEKFKFYYGYRDYWYRLIKKGMPIRIVSNALVHHFYGRTRGVVNKDFKQIEIEDNKKFKDEWGKVNSKQLLREYKLDQKIEKEKEESNAID